jgi:hypothetical protein
MKEMITISPFYLISQDQNIQTHFECSLDQIKKALEEHQIVRQTQKENGSFETEYDDGTVLVEKSKEQRIREQKFAEFLCHPDNILIGMGGMTLRKDGQMETTLTFRIPVPIVKEMQKEFPSLLPIY